MPESVDRRHLLLIGAGPGVVRRFGCEGFRSTLISRGETLEQLTPELRSEGLEIDAVGADIEDLDGYRATLERIFRAPGAPGVAVYNAAVPDPGEILDATVGRLRTAYDVDVLGAVVAAQVAAPVLRTGRHRHIALHQRRLRRPSGARTGDSLYGEGRPTLGGDPDRRRCPGRRHPCRNRHDRRLDRARDGVRSGQHRGTLLDRPHRPDRRLAERVSIHRRVTGPGHQATTERGPHGVGSGRTGGPSGNPRVRSRHGTEPNAFTSEVAHRARAREGPTAPVGLLSGRPQHTEAAHIAPAGEPVRPFRQPSCAYS